MTPSIIFHNRTILQKYKINDNIVVTSAEGSIDFGTVIGYTAYNQRRKIYLKVKMITQLPLRESDGPIIYTIDPDLTAIEHC